MTFRSSLCRHDVLNMRLPIGKWHCGSPAILCLNIKYYFLLEMSVILHAAQRRHKTLQNRQVLLFFDNYEPHACRPQSSKLKFICATRFTCLCCYEVEMCKIIVVNNYGYIFMPKLWWNGYELGECWTSSLTSLLRPPFLRILRIYSISLAIFYSIRHQSK